MQKKKIQPLEEQLTAEALLSDSFDLTVQLRVEKAISTIQKYILPG